MFISFKPDDDQDRFTLNMNRVTRIEPHFADRRKKWTVRALGVPFNGPVTLFIADVEGAEGFIEADAFLSKLHEMLGGKSLEYGEIESAR